MSALKAFSRAIVGYTIVLYIVFYYAHVRIRVGKALMLYTVLRRGPI